MENKLMANKLRDYAIARGLYGEKYIDDTIGMVSGFYELSDGRVLMMNKPKDEHKDFYLVGLEYLLENGSLSFVPSVLCSQFLWLGIGSGELNETEKNAVLEAIFSEKTKYGMCEQKEVS